MSISKSAFQILGAIIIANLLLIAFTASLLFDTTQKRRDVSVPSLSNENDANVDQRLHVEIWNKAAIGQYIWEDILLGGIDVRREHDLYIEGTRQIETINFTFRSGPSLKVPSLRAFSVRNILLIVNWRNREKINYSIPWLDTLETKSDVRNVGVIALGDEQCNNKWFLPRWNESEKIRFLFTVYDWSRVDDHKIFQWPLGVATYRNFPRNDWRSLSPRTDRPYLCNYIATVYPNSSRQTLADFFANPRNQIFADRCLIKLRSQWLAHESDQSLEYYVQALKLSQLTLSPIGQNHECYRILEAVEYGSIPVIEIDLRHVRRSSCDRREALRLFRRSNAPFIYVHDWNRELPQILRQQMAMSAERKASQRLTLIKWYHRFKIELRNKLVSVIQNKFV